MTEPPKSRRTPDPDTSNTLLALLLAAPFMAQLDATIANVAVPSIHADLGASGATLQLIIGGYLIAFGMLLITGARLGEVWGYRRLYLGGMGLFSLASLACGLAGTPIVLVIARVLQGAGAALMFPQSLTGIQLNFTGERRLRAIGLYAIALSTGAVAGQILGGILVSADIAGTLWRPIFLVNVPVGILVLLGAWKRLPPDIRGGESRLDLAGVASLSTCLLLLVLPLVLGRSAGWPLWTWLALAASGVAFAIFLAIETNVEARGRPPLVSVGIVRRPRVLLPLATIMITAGGYYALLFTLAQYLQSGLGKSALVSGLTLVPWVAAFGLAGRVLAYLPGRLLELAPPVGCALLVVAYGTIGAVLAGGGHPEGVLLGLLAIGGFGLGLVFSSLITRVTNEVPAEYAADISGVSTTSVEVGGVIGIAAFGTLYLSRLGLGALDATHAFSVVAVGLAASAFLAGLFSLLAMRASSRAADAED